MTGVPTDLNARHAIATDLDSTLIVEAAAGTGKTTELVNRILEVLKGGRARIEEIVAVTFTEKAAGELKLRLRERLENERSESPNGLLDAALAKLEEAHVNTIHGFCADLLRERPVEARVDPIFRVLTQPEADRLYARAFTAWLQEALTDPPGGLRRALRRTSMPVFGERNENGPVDRLRNAGRTLAEWRAFPRPWSRPPFDRRAQVERHIEALHRLAELTAGPINARDNLHADTDAVRRISRQIALEQSFGHEDLDGWEARLVDLTRDRGFSRTRKGSGYKYSSVATRTDVLGARDRLFADLQQFRLDADADLAAALQQELAGATDRYQALKQAAGALDFSDLLERARDLIRGDASIRSYLQRKFTRVFVDEFQDTDPVQAEILLQLAGGEPGKLFIVGDPKQSIYRFRGTDVGTYWQVSRDLQAQGARLLQLTKSYRSVPPIQKFVNAAFRDVMTGDVRTLQADYIPLEESRAAHDTQPAIVALPVPEPYGRSARLSASAIAIEKSLPDAVGAFVHWLLDPDNERSADQQWTVEEGGHRVRIQPRHIAILFRRFTSFDKDMTREYIDAIEARAIPHLLVGGKAFHGREEVETIRAALSAIEWPDDELSVFATLKGSLFAVDDEHLLEFRHRFGRFHPFRIPRELGGNAGDELALTGEPVKHLLPIASALRALQTLHRGRNYRPVADTIGRLLTETRAHVGLILRPAGEQALANVLHVAELARQYEAAGGISFRGFIDELRDAVSTDAAEAPILEEGSDGVRLMTVHKAKGLEFPVVILADMTCRMSRADAARYLDAAAGLCAVKIGGWAPRELHDHGDDEIARDEAEGIRLAYVAATRARDLLVVPAVGDEAWDGGWFGPLNRALYPAAGDRRTARRGPGCPPFKSKDTVLERPNGEPAGPATVCPGEHAFGDYSIVWWDPHELALGKKAPFGVRRDDLIVKDVPRNVVADGRGRYDRWLLARHDARARGAIPSLTIRTAGEVAGEPGEGLRADDVRARDVQIIDLPGRDAGRSGGAAFGVLVHAILAAAPFGAASASVERIALREARALGVSDDEAREAAAVASRALTHDLAARARRAEQRGACRRETPVTLTIDLEDGGGRRTAVVEGVVDLAFEEDGVWTVVDYKTDREIAALGEERYRRQVALYVSAVARASGQRARGVIVRV